MIKEVALVLVLANTGGARNEYKTVYFPTLEDCYKVLKETKIVHAPSSAADDNTWIGAATCGYEQQESK